MLRKLTELRTTDKHFLIVGERRGEKIDFSAIRDLCSLAQFFDRQREITHCQIGLRNIPRDGPAYFPIEKEHFFDPEAAPRKIEYLLVRCIKMAVYMQFTDARTQSRLFVGAGFQDRSIRFVQVSSCRLCR